MGTTKGSTARSERRCSLSSCRRPVKNPRDLYCGAACRTTAAAESPDAPRRCVYGRCGAPIPDGEHGLRTYCTGSCRAADHARAKRDARPDRPCANEACDQVVPGSAPTHQRFCSNRCKQAVQYQLEREQRLADRRRRYYADHDLTLERKRNYYQAERIRDPGAVTRRYRAQLARNPQLPRQRRLREVFGLTLEDYDQLVAAKPTCWVCHAPPEEGRNLAVDHDHNKAKGERGFIRGLLCITCNVWLGHFENGADWMPAAARYLERPRPALGEAAEVDVAATPYWHRRLGITTAQYNALLGEQGDRCAMCGGEETWAGQGESRRLAVDHDHAIPIGEPGCIRGLLCSLCNTRLGMFERYEWRASMARYLIDGPALADQVLRAAREALASTR